MLDSRYQAANNILLALYVWSMRIPRGDKSNCGIAAATLVLAIMG